jgi:hypothetical protein
MILGKNAFPYCDSNLPVSAMNLVNLIFSIQNSNVNYVSNGGIFLPSI